MSDRKLDEIINKLNQLTEDFNIIKILLMILL
jgi:hypothetical protein